MLKENENDDEKLTDVDYITQNLFRERKVINDEEEEEEEEAKTKVGTSITDTPYTTTTNIPTPVNAASNSNKHKHKFDKKEGCKRKSYNNEEEKLKKKIKISEPSTSRGRNFASLLYNVLSNENCILFPEADADKENFHFNLKSALTYVSRNDSPSHYFQTNGNFERKEKIEEEVVAMSNFPPPLFFSEAFASKFLRENKINIYAKAHKIFGKKTNFKMNSIKKLSEGKYELSKKHDPKLRMEDDFASISSPPPLSPSSSDTTTTTTNPLAHVENFSDTNCRNSEIFSSSSSRVLEEYAKEFSTFSSSNGRRGRLLYLVLNDDNGGDDDDNNNNNEKKDDDEEFKFRLLTPPLRENDSSFSTFLFPFDKTITNQNRVGEDIISQSGSNARQSKRIRVEIPTSFLHISYICEKELQKLLRIKGIEDGGGDNEETFLSYLKEKSKNFDTRIVVDENQQQQHQQEQYRKDISRNEGGDCRGDGDGVKIIVQNNAINDNNNNKSKNNKNKKYDALTDFLWQHDFEVEIEKQLAHLISMKGKHIKDSSIKVIKDIIRKYFYYNAVLYLCNDEINKNGKNENIFPPVPSNYLALKMFFFARGSHIGKKTFFHQLNTLKFYLFRALPKRNMNRILAENWYDREYSRNKIHLTGNLNFGQPKKNSLSAATIVSSLKFLFNTIKTGEKRMMMMMMRKMVPARGQKRKDHDHDHVNDDDDGDNGDDDNGNREGDDDDDDDDDGEIGNIKKVLRSHCRHLLFLYFGMVYFCRWSDINSVTLKSAIDLLHGLPLYLDSKASSTNVSLNEKTGERGTSHLKQRYPHILGLPTHILNLLGFNVVELNKLVRDVAKQKNRYTIGSALSETLISRVIVKNEETRTRLMKSVRTYNDSLNIVMGFDIGMPPLPPHNLLGNVYENDIPKCVENHYGFDAINYCKSRVMELMVKMKKDYSENKINDNNNNIIISPPPLLPHHHHHHYHHLPPPTPELRFNQFFFPDGMKNESAAEMMTTTGAAAEAEATTYKNYREARLLPPPPPPHHHHHHHSFKNPYSHHIQYPFYYEATGTKINSDEPVKYSVTKFWDYSSFNDIFVVFNESRLSLKKSTPKRAAMTKEKRTSSSSISSSSSSAPPLFYRVLNFGDLALYAIYILVHHCDYDLNDRIFPESYRGQEKFINNMVLCDYVNFGIPVISQNLRQRQRRQPSSWNFKNKSSSDCNNNNIKTNEDFENAVFFKKALKDRIEIAKLHLKTNSHAKSHIFRVSAFSMVVDSILNMIGKIREDNKAAGTFAKFFKLFGKIHLSHENLNTHLRYYNQYSAVQRVLSAKRGHFSTKKHLRASEKHDDKSKETLNEKALKMVAAAATAAAAANNNNNNIENENENDNNNTTNYISSIPFYISREKEEPKKDPVCASFWFVELYNEIASRKKTSNLKNINNKDNNIDNFDEKNRNLYLFSSSQYSINRADPDEQFWEMMFSNHFFLVDDFTLTPKIISIKKRDIINSMQSKENCKIKNANQISKDNYNTKFKNEMFLNENSDIVLAEKAKELLKDEVVILCEKRVLHKNQVKDYKF